MPTGVPGLDSILYGGLPKNRFIVAQGSPGTGKTTLALQYLLEGVRRGERVLFITLAQTEDELARAARSYGFALDGINVHGLEPTEVMRRLGQQQDIFPTSEVELGKVSDLISDVVNKVKPERLAFDSVGDIRLLSNNPYLYRQQIIALRHFLESVACTSVFTDISQIDDADTDLQALADGVIKLERSTPDYGDKRYRLNVQKMRGMDFHGGFHDYRIGSDGIEVYPRTVVADISETIVTNGSVKSDCDELDRMLGGGPEPGTAYLLLGPSGAGKTTLSTLYAHAAAARGERSALFLFDERQNTFKERAKALGLDLTDFLKSGLIHMEEVNVGTMSPGEFAHRVQREVDADARLIVIDSLTGYLAAMPQERLLVAQMHELLTALSKRGVLTLFTVAQHGLLNEHKEDIDLSYLADTVVLLSYVRQGARIDKTVTVVKKRLGPHDTSVRRLSIGPGGVTVGVSLSGSQDAET